MIDFAVKGNIVSAESKDNLNIVKDGYIIIKNGKIHEISHRFSGDIPVFDYKNSIIAPGFCDMHVHAPQYANRGIGLDEELLPWLSSYTFPEEMKFSDESYAKKVYTQFAQSLVSNGTTNACVFATIHTNSVYILMDILEKSGINAYVGRVNMDRDSGGLTENTDVSLKETEEWVSECKMRYKNVKPIITPRFAPSCSEKLLRGLSEIAQREELPIQSHLDENMGEIKLVSELFPESRNYAGVYDDFSLLNGKTIMAHCVYCSDEEIEELAQKGVYAAHCPESNMNLSSGIAPVKKLSERGVEIVLGSDISGGSSLCMADIMGETVKASKLLSVFMQKDLRIDAKTAFYFGCGAPMSFFGQKKGFCVGNDFNAVVISDEDMINFDEYTVEKRLERLLFIHENRKIESVYSKGAKIF